MRRLEDEEKKRNMTVSLDRATIAQIDQSRGLIKRSSYVQSLLDRVLGTG
jgi:hypothetical protein